LQPVADRNAAPLAEIRQAGIEELRSMSHYGECRAPGNSERDAYCRGLAGNAGLRQSLSRFPMPTCGEAILGEEEEEKASWDFLRLNG